MILFFHVFFFFRLSFVTLFSLFLTHPKTLLFLFSFRKTSAAPKSPKGRCVVGAFGNTVSLSSDTPLGEQRVIDFSLPAATNVSTNAYFETQLTKLPPGCCVALGFVTSSKVSSLPVDTLPGWDRHTVGVHTDDGGIYLGAGNGQEAVAHVPRRFQEGDVVGVGLLEGVGFYVTCNGSRVWREHIPSSSSSSTSASSSSSSASAFHTAFGSTSSGQRNQRDVAVGLCGLDNRDAIVVLHKQAVHPVDSARK